MRLDRLEGRRTLQWSSLHSSHPSGIMDILTEVGPCCSSACSCLTDAAVLLIGTFAGVSTRVL